MRTIKYNIQKINSHIINASSQSLYKIILIILLLFIWSMITHSKIAGEGDEPHYMMISQSLIFDGDIDLTNNYADKNNIIQNGRLDLNSNHIKLVSNGKYYPIHDIGMPLLYAPIYGVVELASIGIWFAIPEPLLKKIKLDPFGLLTGLMAFWGIFLTSLLVYMLYSVSCCLTNDKVTAFWGCLLFGLSPPVLSFSYLYFTELISAIIILYLFMNSISEDYRLQRSMLLGLLLGFLFLVHARNAGAVAALGIILFSKYIRVNIRSCFVFLFSFFVVIVLRTCLNYFLWNSVLTTPHASISLGASFLYSIQEIFIRLFGWLFDREHGLYVFAPVYCLMFAGLYQLFLKNRKVFYDMAMIISMYVIIMALPFFNRHGWGGGWSPAGRFLLPISPLFALGIVVLFSESQSIIVRIIVILQVILNLFFWQFPKLLWNGGDQNSEFLLTLFFGDTSLENMFPSLYLANGYSIALCVILTILIGLISVYLSREQLSEGDRTKRNF